MAYTVEYGLRRYIDIIREKHPGTIGEMLKFQVVSCDEGKDDYVLTCKTEPWMCNHYGTLHGGLCATILDQAMGMVCCCLKKGFGTCTTVQLEADYHRPLTAGEDILVKVHVVSVTRSLINMTAELVQPSKPDKISVSGSAIFFYKDDDRVPQL
ncbi:MAG: PaaI family thioesterase [Oscillospiraceae bacterium]|nr:PaaI family thioesterase [Oscillospiraceae bacterium]